MARLIIRQEVIDIAHSYGVKVSFRKLESEAGLACLRRELVILAKNADRETTLSTLMHEIGHIVAKREGKFKVYHSVGRVWTRKLVRKYVQTALRAELYVDRWAEREFKKLFPELKYERAYRTKEHRKWFRETQLKGML